MTKYNKNTLQRVDKFFERLSGKYNIPLAELTCTVYVTKEPVPYAERMSGERKDLRIGDSWGELFDCGWFCFNGQLPEGYAPEELALLIDISGEGLVYEEQNGPLLGLTNGSFAYEHGSIRKHVVPLHLCTVQDGNIEVWVEGGCNDLFGQYPDSGKLKEALIVKRLPQMRAFYYDYFVLREALNNLGIDTPRYAAILKTLNDAINVMYDFSEEEALHARQILSKELDKKGGDPSLMITAIGHSHIDLAWLWPIRETIRKGARTFATATQMMERYPDYRFGASQPQLLAWMKAFYPPLFAKIKELVHEGRFELQGAMWVEPDTNLTGGEALVRQIFYGARFWREEFGVEVDNIWLPDVFGYSGALPQIMVKSGLRYFMTQKLSWNEHNPFPYHTFNWKGIDGSEVLVHMLPEETYNSPASPASIRLIEKNFREKGVSDQALMLFGIGDGGGGPSAYHLEKLARLKNLADFSPVQQRFARDFFRDIDRHTGEYPTWKGELYFENHRGTLTSAAHNKKYNRRMEYDLRELEWASVMAELYAEVPYPHEWLETVWKEVLLYQFHDILPGSSIRRVYEESLARYEQLDHAVRERIAAVYGQLAQGWTAFNSLSFAREEYVQANGRWYRAQLPPMGYVHLTEIAEAGSELTAGDRFIENGQLRVVFAEDGSIRSIYDKIHRKEALEAGKRANAFEVYDDTDGNAWDIQIYYDEQPPRSFRLVERRSYVEGIDAVMEQAWQFGASRLAQRIKLRQDSPFVEFDTHVDWHERQKMLRTAFAVDVYTDEAVCDIQFGHIKRPTHRNTSWDMTRFEICAHKWVDLSREDYGVALLNDCKYGYKVLGNVLDLNLLRSTVSPDTDADQGEHDFRYAIYPHVGNERAAQVEQVALAFNIRPAVVNGQASVVLPESLLAVDKGNIEVTAVKKAEDGSGTVIRLFETDGVATDFSLHTAGLGTACTLCDLMERELSPIVLQEDGSIRLHVKPFEIITIKVGG